ncbi:MAG: glycosyltransferase, partial [Rhodospirillales bacterium]|nr:glycosyltransferase [Rhodospirillales bacterium]
MSGFSISSETVAIITRTRNRPLLLGRAMDSVLAQSWTGWHHYVVNDGGAPDAVEALAARRSDAYAGRLTLIHNPRSLGMEAASNVGIRRGREDFIVIHDDDDSWHPDFLAATVEFLRDTGDRFAGAITHTVRVWEEIADEEVRELSRENDFNTYLRAVHLAAVARGNQFPPISFLFRRTALEAVGTYDEAFPVLGDWDFNLRFLARFDIGVVERPLAFWHNRGGSGEQASSVVGALKKHLEYDAALRNRLLRRALSGDAEASAIGLMANTETAVAAAVQREREISRLATLLEQENRRFESEKGHLASRFELELGRVHALLGARDREIEQLHHRLAESLADKEYLKGHVTNFSGRVEVLTERVAALTEREAAATAREAAANAQAAAATAQAAGLMRESAELRTRIAALYGSWSWKLSLPVRLTGRLLRRLSRRTPPVLNQSDERTPTPSRDYAAWITLYDTPPPQALARLRERAAASGIPVAVCVLEGQPGCPALVSLETQIHAPARLLTVAEFDTLTEQWVVFLRPEDQLAPHALACLAVAAAETSAAVIYADEDCLDAEGRRHMPWFKPEPNPEWMLSQDLPGAFVAWRCARIAAAGGWTPHPGTAAAYDLSLRLWAEGALHLPHILVHRRSPQPIPEHGAAAVLAHLRRRGLKGEGILSGGRWHIRHAPPEDRRITAIIPTRDRADVLRQCLDGLLKGTDWPDLEVLIVDNGSREETTLALFREVAADPRVRVLPMDGPFNYAALNNAAAR